VRAAVLVGPRRIELTERALGLIGPDDVLVRVSACGLCTSDLEFWLGHSDREFPAALGHEVVGTVAQVGQHVNTLVPGSRVVCCVEGGGFAEAVVAQERFCIAVSDSCPYPEAAEPLSCLVNAVLSAAPQLGDDVVIIGAGFMGNLLQLVLQLRGPRTITVADVRPDALARARALGATYTVDTSSEDLARRVAEVTEGRGADVSFEVTGTNRGLDLMEAVTRMSGKLCIVGYHQSGTREIRLGYWNWMAFNIINAHFRDQSTVLSGMRTGLRLLEGRVLDPQTLFTHSYSLEDLDGAFQAAATKKPGFVKAVIRA
jgi:threonine dehydrogenase-like Zn-dependent dehydrogenase